MSFLTRLFTVPPSEAGSTVDDLPKDVPLFIVARNCGTSEAMIRKHYAKLLATKELVMMKRAAGAFRLRVIKGGKRAA